MDFSLIGELPDRMSDELLKKHFIQVIDFHAYLEE